MNSKALGGHGMKGVVRDHCAVKLLVCLLLILGFASSSHAANRYVRAGASGAANGSDWTNAYPALPTTLVRGDTYYVAAGSYGSYSFRTATSGTTLITVKKATVADHGTSVGWSDAFASGQAVFSPGVSFNSSFWVFDGVTGGGPGSWTTGHGFKVLNRNGVVMDFSGGNNITVRHVEAQGNGGDGDGAFPSNDIVGINNGVSNVTISYSYLYDAGRTIMIVLGGGSNNIVLEYSYTGYFESTAGQHSELCSCGSQTQFSNLTFRYNVFTHAEGTGGLIMHGDGAFIYGNVFYQAPGDNWSHGNGLIGTWTSGTLTNAKVYNNTFIVSSGWTIFGPVFTPPNTGNEVRNNVFYGIGNNPLGLGTLFPVYSHNHYVDTSSPSGETAKSTATGVPFVNVTGLDFRLKAGTPAGMALGAPYDRDMFGTVRGSDGTWDRGAAEFGGTTMSGPNNPSNLTLN